MTESITTPNALVQTSNGKRFYVHSGVVNVTTADTTMISIDNIGERDIKISLEVGSLQEHGNDSYVTFKVNGIIIFGDVTRNTAQDYGLGRDEYRFIIPANASLEVIMVLGGGATNWSVAGHGKYLSID